MGISSIFFNTVLVFLCVMFILLLSMNRVGDVIGDNTFGSSRFLEVSAMSGYSVLKLSKRVVLLLICRFFEVSSLIGRNFSDFLILFFYD